jgi:hypothetical protein
MALRSEFAGRDLSAGKIKKARDKRALNFQIALEPDYLAAKNSELTGV